MLFISAFKYLSLVYKKFKNYIANKVMMANSKILNLIPKNNIKKFEVTRCGYYTRVIQKICRLFPQRFFLDVILHYDLSDIFGQQILLILNIIFEI